MSGSTPLDIFICHASEDKADVARPIATALKARGYNVFYDEYSLKLGDGLRRSLDRGLTACRFGLVILSESFFEKSWPQLELDALATKEIVGGRKTILPVWHGLTRDDVARHSAMLADRLAASTGDGIERVVEQVVDVLDDQEVSRVLPAMQAGEAARDRLLTDLRAWHAKSLARFLALVNKKMPMSKSPYRYGYWTLSYKFATPGKSPSLTELREALQKAQGQVFAWKNTFRDASIYPYYDCLEYWALESDPTLPPRWALFWRAQPDGSLMLVAGLEDDSEASIGEPGKLLDIDFPLWRMAECVLHVRNLARELGCEGSDVAIMATWEGLDGRKLATWANRNRWGFHSDYLCRQEQAANEVVVAVSSIDSELEQIVYDMTSPLFSAFELWSHGLNGVRQALADFRRQYIR